ncbi:hypothetical protein SLS62_005019 [Diatrype stigma]|uniref:Fucose-specific lectin n=1 Tax=Diatrype stigma TaxID=117547 RepID=A0AAN9UPW4_9PEZI
MSFSFGGSSITPALTLVVWLWLLPALVHGDAINAWIVDALEFPHVVMHDDAAGKIFYSLCNSSSAPIFPADESAAFDLKFPPLNGTGVAGFGYTDTTHGITAQFFYQTDDGGIVDASFYCDSATGKYTPSDKQWVVSTGVEGLPAIRQPSSIEALPMGASAGQRIYFRDADNQPAVLGYHPDFEKWQFDGYVLQTNLSSYSGSIGAAILDTQNVTLALAVGNDIGISRLGESDWILTGLPVPIFADPQDGSEDVVRMTNETDPGNFTLWLNQTDSQDWSLDAFDSSAVNLGVAFSARGTLSVFYIGDNGVLHQINQTDRADDSWNRAEQQGPERWPVADVDNANFGMAQDFSNDKIWIYYMSGESMTQIYQSSSGVWELAVALARSSNDTSQDTANGGSNPTDGGEGSSRNEGMARGVRIGVGIGISLGVLALGGIIGTLSWYCRRRTARNNIAELPGSIRGARSPAHPTENQWGASRDQQRYPVEKHGDELFELPLQGQRHEMENTQLSELPDDVVYEMPGDTFLRPQT